MKSLKENASSVIAVIIVLILIIATGAYMLPRILFDESKVTATIEIKGATWTGNVDSYVETIKNNYSDMYDFENNRIVPCTLTIQNNSSMTLENVGISLDRVSMRLSKIEYIGDPSLVEGVLNLEKGGNGYDTSVYFAVPNSVSDDELKKLLPEAAGWVVFKIGEKPYYVEITYAE